ncbi:MAG: helix-turn-helix domain-containing protein [Selenomonadaceae bacterium]|nr:helix-turn-helix domain-containing protein [Selenomonadaceae bacterium]
MFKKNEFKAAMVRKGLTAADIAKALGIDPATLFRKMSGQSDFFRNEIEKLCVLLELSAEDTLKIFFA